MIKLTKQLGTHIEKGAGRQDAALTESIRAALESIAFQSADLISAMEQAVGQSITALRVDGGKHSCETGTGLWNAAGTGKKSGNNNHISK